MCMKYLQQNGTSNTEVLWINLFELRQVHIFFFNKEIVITLSSFVLDIHNFIYVKIELLGRP